MGNTDTPIVFCHGLFGWGDCKLGGYPYFVSAKFLKQKMGDALPPFIFPSMGPISSLHDRACELFFHIKGGLTNYGIDHSKKYNHKQYSRYYHFPGICQPDVPESERSTDCFSEDEMALYPAWDEDHPLDFVGHSMGAVVIRMLQYLLETDFFYEQCGFPEHTSAKWVRSLTSIAGVHNGSTLAWVMGANEETGLLEQHAYAVRILLRILNRYAKFQTRHPNLAKMYDLHLDQWGLDRKVPLLEILSVIQNEPDFIRDIDWALYDLTPNAMEKYNRFLKEYPDTWYFSYVTRSTIPLFGKYEFPLFYFTRFYLWPFALSMGHYKPKSKRWRKKRIQMWRANDGMCPSASQDYPRLGRIGKHASLNARKKIKEKISPGIWHIRRRFRKVDHFEVAMQPHFFRLKKGWRIYEEIVKTIMLIRSYADS
ncbi:hypothetical protein K7I13_00440 [Brucepastera parasyntrophica]|uniref:lipase-like domain-containing protein n=1 Tax=Brucepastera parasyntrophica TaxID=2880008 RepID=UPI00210B1092|nr:hypothetical protein [Brucepastera parasyntrophica]ULQ59859.1 hypothetical protein K7I13_00440 [Brucepastera parasyntrophica]